MRARLAWLVMGSLAAVACGGGGRHNTPIQTGGAELPPAAPGDDTAEPSAYAPPASAPEAGEEAGSSYSGESEAVEAAPSRAAPSPRSAARKAPSADVFRPRPEPEARWGLATVWGESLSSPVNSVPFARDSEAPFASSAMYYNDARGVSKMAGWPGEAGSGDGLWLGGGAFRVRLLDPDGRPLPSWQSGSRTYTVGEEGRRYVIQIENHTSERIEAVTTVDGLDVIDGQPGAYSKRGYLVSPWSTLEIDGFRQSEHSVAAFRFGAVPDSYAARKGNARNVGVIGVALFRERGVSPRWPDREVERRHSADPFPSRYAAPPSPRIVN